MMIRIQELRPSFVRVNPGDKSENRLYKAVPLNFGRDYWTRTSDLAPPRRVRYQLR